MPRSCRLSVEPLAGNELSVCLTSLLCATLVRRGGTGWALTGAVFDKLGGVSIVSNAVEDRTDADCGGCKARAIEADEKLVEAEVVVAETVDGENKDDDVAFVAA